MIAHVSDAHRGIAERWGTSILSPDGAIDRAALRRIVFSDPAELDRLLKRGAEKAAVVAEETLQHVRKALRLL